MKRSLLVAMFSMWMVCGAQISYPTVREVYDFAVGDTFQYRRWTSFGTNLAYCRVILSRTDYANDSIVYLSKNIYTAFVDTSRLTIGVLDSAAYRQSFGNGWNNFSTSISTYAGDTAYAAQAHTTITRYCDPITGYKTFDLHADYQCAIGLGETFISVNDSGTAGNCAYSWYEQLVYLHKTNGIIAGTPDSSLFTTIEEIRNPQFAIRISPNPATTSVTLQLEQTPSSSTTFQLFDVTGRMILQKSLTETTNRVELSGVSKGMYLYNVQSDKERLGAGKLIVEP
ncbi:MAG: T9SS type A sorting domain-containing protein [Bacteroidota bacterium]